MTKYSGINPSFSPRIIPILNGLYKEQLENLVFPLYLQAVPKGTIVFIRSGIIQTIDSLSVKNIDFKCKFKELVDYTRKLKVTIEIIVSSDIDISEYSIREKLLSYDSNIEDLNITILDKVFEHSPYFLDFKLRIKGMKHIFIPTKIGIFPKLAVTEQINSKKEFNDVLNSLFVLGYNKFRIISPSCKYKFGELEDLFKDGGIAEIRSNTKYEAELIQIVPEINKNKETSFYSASELIVKYNNQKISIPLEDKSIIIKTKIWENKENLIGSTIVYSGVILPGYEYPSHREFIRFKKNI